MTVAVDVCPGCGFELVDPTSSALLLDVADDGLVVALIDTFEHPCPGTTGGIGRPGLIQPFPDSSERLWSLLEEKLEPCA